MYRVRKIDDFALELLEAICDFQDTHGFSPTQRELAETLYVSNAKIFSNLGVLMGAGYISVEYNKPRSICVLYRPEDARKCPENGEADYEHIQFVRGYCGLRRCKLRSGGD